MYFKQGKAADAVAPLEHAVRNAPQASVVLDHLGDVYAALDMKKEAIAAWQKGLTMEDVSKRDIERRKSVTKKLRAAGAEAMVAHLKLLIAKLRHERFGASSERSRKLLDQIEHESE